MEQLRWAVAVLFFLVFSVDADIDRQKVVRRFNPQRTASSDSPIQIGNGNFAFGADITGLQTFLPFNTLSSWAWHNASLPKTPGQTSTADFTGLDWLTHGRLVNYAQPNPAEPEISNWMIRNPHRVNLGRIGLWFGENANVVEADLREKRQTLDLFQGEVTSTFMYNGTDVEVTTYVDPLSDTVAITVMSQLLFRGDLALFFDFPYPTLNKFDAPFVGNWSAVGAHTSSLQQSTGQAVIQHDMDSTRYFTSLLWEGSATIKGPLPGSHRYVLKPKDTTYFRVSVNYAPTKQTPPAPGMVRNTSVQTWARYWGEGAFIDTAASADASPNAVELQRRIILSQYLLAVNEAGKDPPQESGLANNGWYGKFHMEMYLWHGLHWALWDKWSYLDKSLDIYKRFLPTSLERAKKQGYSGARWGKMSDPTGRSAPGEINSLLIWQQPHPMYFAEMQYRAYPNATTLERWDEILTATADFMASYAFWNESTKVYDLGPPMYPVSENTNPNATRNPTFELAYWWFGLDIAAQWKKRLHQSVPEKWTHVAEHLAPLPIVNGTYEIYEGIPNMWIDPVTKTDHPAMIGIFGLLPPVPGVNTTIVSNTMNKIFSDWDFANLYGWDFPMLAMSAARLGQKDRAVSLLLDKNFAFDDVGLPVGGSRVPTPYFPMSGGLLAAVAMITEGWDGDGEEVKGGRWPEGWKVERAGFVKGM